MEDFSGNQLGTYNQWLVGFRKK